MSSLWLSAHALGVAVAMAASTMQDPPPAPEQPPATAAPARAGDNPATKLSMDRRVTTVVSLAP